MSSRILAKPEAEAAGPLAWRQLHTGAIEAEQAEDPAEAVQHGLAAEPTVQEKENGQLRTRVQELEARILQMEREIPIREQQARQAGEASGRTAAEKLWQDAIEKAGRAAVEVASLRPRLRRQAEQDTVRLATAMARRVLRREVTLDREAILGVLRTALDHVELREVTEIRIRPEDQVAITTWMERSGAPGRIQVVADSTLERGALVVECHRGQLDASIETQLEEIERGFADLLEQRRNA